MTSKTVPIIILNWNGLSDTVECIESLKRIQEFPREIILVDNGSGQEEQLKLKQLFQDDPEIQLILNNENKGFTKGTSDIVEKILSREQTPEFIALLNNDTVVAPNWIKSLVDTAEDFEADIVTSKMINYYDRSLIDNVGHFMLNTGEILPLGHRHHKETYNSVIENLGACGGAALYRTRMITEIGFFDPYFGTGYEDAEFGLRAKLLGYKCILAPKAIVYHKVSRSINKIKNDAYLQNIQTNILYTYVKLMPFRFLVFNFVFVLFKYLIWFIFGVFSFQLKLIRLHTKTLFKFFGTDLKKALEQRKTFFQQFKPKMVYKSAFWAPSKFFVGTDFERLIIRMFPG